MSDDDIVAVSIMPRLSEEQQGFRSSGSPSQVSIELGARAFGRESLLAFMSDATADPSGCWRPTDGYLHGPSRAAPSQHQSTNPHDLDLGRTPTKGSGALCGLASSGPAASAALSLRPLLDGFEDVIVVDFDLIEEKNPG